MRHRKAGKKLNRSGGHRRALYRNLLKDLFRYKRIKTTEAKAKAIQGNAEKLITLAKEGSLHSRRLALSYLPDSVAVKSLFAEIGPLHKDRSGGYTRILKLGSRKGDNAPMVLLELVE